jgi:gliding motility-associated-like protein
MIMGNFKNDPNTNIVFVNPLGSEPLIYLYIDDVSVYKCNTPVYGANAGVDKTICPGESVQLQMQYFQEYKYKWYTINGSLLDTTNAITVKPDSTTQYVLWIRDFKYDQSWDTVTVVVDESCIPWEVPNVFTPNGDGFNDEFYAKCDKQLNFSISVFNRWGKKIFESTGNRHWDGKENGTPCAEGVYYYIVEAHFKNGTSKTKSGTVTLVR